MDNVIKEIKLNDAQCYQANQTKQCVMLSRKSNQANHSVAKEM